MAEKIKNDIYVDNLVTGTTSESEAINLYKSTKSIFRDAAMNIREWTTNSDTVNTLIPEEDRVATDTIKVLGHTWNTKRDTLAIKPITITNEITKPTKRTALKEISSVYDPLGLFSPILLRGKVLIQSLWTKGLGWDDELEYTDTLNGFRSDKNCQNFHSVRFHGAFLLNMTHNPN